MTPADWQLVKSLFLEGEALPARDRQAMLLQLKENEEAAKLLSALFEQPESAGPRLSEPCWVPPNPSSPAPRAFQVGERLIDRFEVVGFLGAGGVGEVYRAYDHTQSVFVALKTLRTSLGLDEGALRMLRNELNTARSITHPNICRLYDLHWPTEDGGRPFFTMELIEGETLAERIHREGRLSAESARPLVDQLFDALAAAHDHGVIHRDLKTGNIMLCAGSGRLVVMDFGLARGIESTPVGSSSPTAHFAGTAAYMAPEQLRGKRASFSSDIHALGVVLFEMVTGRRPFEGATIVEIASRRLNEKAPSARQWAPGLNRSWDIAISRCLAVHATDRPPSVLAVRRLLDQPPPWLGSRRSMLAGSALLAAPILAAGAYWAQRLRTTPILTLALFDVENQSGDRKLDYLCRGVSNELLRRLSQLSWISVVPMHVNRRPTGIKAPAALALAGVLQSGSGDPVFRFTLSGERSQAPAWSQAFALKDWNNMVALQDAVAATVTARLRTHASPGWPSLTAQVESARSVSSPTANSAALDSYMRASQLLQEQSAESVRIAIDYLEQAVSADPHFALAYASLGEAYLALQNFGVNDSKTAERARNYAQRAIQEEPGLAEGHAVLAAVRQLDWDWAGSEASYNEALRLKPSFARAYRWRAGLHLQFARFQQALDDNEMSWKLDPYDRSAIAGHGLCLLFGGKPKEAADFLSREIADRDLPSARYNLGQAYARLGQLSAGAEAQQYFSKALAEAERVAQIERRSPAFKSELSAQMFAFAWSVQGKAKEAAPYLEHLESVVEQEKISPGFLARFYTPLRRIEDALTALERAVDVRDRFVFYLRIDCFLENLRGEPRFQRLLRTVGLK